MRYTGPYNAASVPPIAELFALSTPERATRLARLLPRVEAACAAFSQAVPNVHNLEKMSVSTAAVDTLIDGYESRTVAIKRRLAAMRESLPPEHADLCPYCSLDSNPDLDHYLPKAEYPEFSLYAYNFMPICAPCNRKKSSSVANDAGERQFLMATHDTCASARVVKVELLFGGTLHVRYYIDPRAPLPVEELCLVDRHFVKLDLATRYRKRAHSYLSAIKKGLRDSSRRSRHEFLSTSARNVEIASPTNGWERALHRALSPDHS